jgi:type II secretory pathway component PulF
MMMAELLDDPVSPASTLKSATVIVCACVFVLIPAMGFSVVWQHLFSRPMLRRELACFFLDLLETALDRGQPVEQAIVSAAGSRDKAMGADFYPLAANIENGMRLGESLQKVPRFLPANISAILQAGEKLGDLKKVLPACRENLRNPSDVVRSLVQYMIAVLLLFAPLCSLVMFWISIFVMPRFRELVTGMGFNIWPLSDFAFGAVPWIIVFEGIVFVSLGLVLEIYTKGPTATRWLQFRSLPIVDWVAWRIPWNRKRLQRTFSAMLAVLLDGGVPEIEAVHLAGDCTVNEICRRRTTRIIAALGKGVKLDEAVRIFDDSGEYHWRLTNATHSRGGFLNALHGWHEALDAKAIQQENAAAQAVASGLVIANGLLVGLIATGMFGVLIAILRGMLDT